MNHSLIYCNILLHATLSFSLTNSLSTNQQNIKNRYSHSNQSHPKHNSKHGPVPSPNLPPCPENVAVTVVSKSVIISVLLVDVMHLIYSFLRLIVMIPRLMFGRRWELCRWKSSEWLCISCWGKWSAFDWRVQSDLCFIESSHIGGHVGLDQYPIWIWRAD